MVATADKIKVWTYEDWQQLPEYGSAPGTNFRYEILGGELLMTAAPLIQHQRIVGNLFLNISNHALAYSLGEALFAPVDVVLSDTDIVQPDIVFIAKNRLSIVAEKDVQGAPDLCVEVVSSYSDRRDRITKFEIYARFGVSFYWIVDPRLQVIEEYQLKDTQYQLVREWARTETFVPLLFPSLQIVLNTLFPNP